MRGADRPRILHEVSDARQARSALLSTTVTMGMRPGEANADDQNAIDDNRFRCCCLQLARIRSAMDRIPSRWRRLSRRDAPSAAGYITCTSTQDRTVELDRGRCRLR